MRSYSSELYTLEQCKLDFERALRETKREGIDALLKYLENKSDFYRAPASTRFHESREGGLLRHSLNVYVRLLNEFANEQSLKPEGEGLKREEAQNMLHSIAIVALLHDLCKADQYVATMRNKKDENGKWIQVTAYQTNGNRMPYGHGEKSVYIASGFIRLTREEAIAIRFHMGTFDNSEEGRDTGLAYGNYELATLLHIADLKATYLDEKDTDLDTAATAK